MRIRIFLLFVFLFIGPLAGFAQTAPRPVDIQQSRILILLDRSSSMINNWSGNEARYQAADKIVLALIDSLHKVNSDVEFSLRVFGHQHTVQEDDCYDTRNEVMFSKDNYTQMAFRLADIKPMGVTPIAYALKEAAENDLVDEQHNAYSIILITDGGESCGGDICEVVRTLLQHKVFFKPYIVSLVDYAPLKTEYACLGDYLQVTNDKAIAPTVGKIVDFYRPMLNITRQDYQALADKIRANPPSIQHISIPAIELPKEAPKPVVQEQPKPVVTEIPKPIVKEQPKPTVKETPKPVVQEQPKPVIKEPVAIPPPPKDTTTAMSVLSTAPIPAPKPVVTTFKPVISEAPPIPQMPEPEEAVQLTINRTLKQLRTEMKPLKAFSPITAAPPPIPKLEQEPVVVAAPPKPAPLPPVVKPAPKPVAAAPKPSPKPKATPKPKTAETEKQMHLVTTNIDATATTVEILFTDSKHQIFYHTMPELILTDAVTGKEVKRFYRTVDAAGNPDPLTDVLPGKYNITIVGRNSGNTRGSEAIPILDKKTNRVMIEVSNGSLKFEYTGDPKRPVDEFSATVVERKDAGGKILQQRCSQELQYDPGNYFVEINTTPVSRKNVDVDFGGESILYIDIPGYVSFTNVNNLGKASLYCQLGDRYVPFAHIDITGNPNEQRMKLQPGVYQAHFIRDPKAPFASEKVVPFTVKSDAITDVELQ